MKVLATNYGANVTKRSQSTGVQSRTIRSAHLTSGNDIELPRLRPKEKGDDYNYRVWAAKTSKIHATGDNGSLTSNDSQRMIIQQDVEWEVNIKENQILWWIQYNNVLRTTINKMVVWGHLKITWEFKERIASTTMSLQ